MKKISKKQRKLEFLLVIFLIVLGSLVAFWRKPAVDATQTTTSQQTASSATASSRSSKETATSKSKAKAVTSASSTSESTSESKVDWQNPSEDKDYPTLQQGDWLDVSIADQRVYIMRDEKVLYTMLCSTGAPDSPTPTGTFQIQAERGDSFFNASSGEGANYWVSFKDHGIYLFHSVPVDENGEYIEEEAELLGKEAISHGCIRLSVADAKWFYENAIYDMRVEIH
ncbi:MAG: L,D-transpeptidase [Enterococcus sp.]